jgi:hypothetical protein
VKLQQGMPALFVDGKLTSTLTFWMKDPKDVQPFTKAGIRIADFSMPFGWVGPEKYDFTKTDEVMDVMDGYLKSDPNLLALPRFEIQPGPWWCQEFPHKITLRADGTPAVFRAPCHPSFASTRYRELAQGALQAFLTHVEGKYGDRIVGYFPGNDIYGEWFSWNAYWEAQPGTSPPTKFGVEDYSEPAKAAFQQWLRKKYQGREDALRAAWGQSQASFEDASVPSEDAPAGQPTAYFSTLPSAHKCPITLYSSTISSPTCSSNSAAGQSGRLEAAKWSGLSTGRPRPSIELVSLQRHHSP